MMKHQQELFVLSRKTLKVKIKRLVTHAEIPEYKTSGAAAVDLVALDYRYDADNKFHEYGTGLAIALPEGYEAEIRPRSSISKYSLVLVNSPGTIDSDYRGELLVRFKQIDDREIIYDVGDRIAQLVIKEVPKVTFEEVDELDETKRGSGGFGSTGS